ncbi:hypothetical protein [Hoeflea alexandrii]|uniref:hypothetical protein n=1 Tax=Hoeflea alexandrii TaxID=288436 RepID=UPI0022B0301C|nr:hypothetical protein [Hoeflea alexandrii]MCZ4288145.1 hypothetical protein [Hoeflea alexandrii]
MFNLIANAMFEAARVPAPPTAPVGSRWFVRGDRSPARSRWQAELAGKADTAPGR